MPHRALLLLTVGGCAILPPTDDYSGLPLPDAMDQTVSRLAEVYSFTEHKGIDWSVHQERLVDEARLAEGDPEAEARVIRSLVATMPDAHVQLWHDDPELDLCPEAEASLGVVLSDLDDGSVIVAASTVDGLQPADEVLTWGGLAIDEARAAAPFHCFPLGAATTARIRQVQLRLLGRAAASDTTSVEVRRAGEALQVELTAAADDADVRQALGIELPETLVSHRMLADDVGYISIGWEETYVTEQRVQRALVDLQQQGAVGLVIDLRDNDGGMERTSANIAGYFTDERAFYETVTFYDGRTGDQTEVSTVWVDPQEVRWTLPVAVLVDAETVSSGEGLAMLLSRSDNVEIVGFEGTAASFGSTGARIHLPADWTLHYPMGWSLDEQGQIQLDSDESLEGGVLPDVRVPWTVETRTAWAAGEDVELDHAVAHVLARP